MEYWRKKMPHGMYLRSISDWHLDPDDIYTIERFFEEKGFNSADKDPIKREVYLEYADWFQSHKQIAPIDTLVNELSLLNGRFIAGLDNGETLEAESVVVAVGLTYFAAVPPQLGAILPPNRFHHTADLVNFKPLRGKRVLIIGGRQSAFEWAALISEEGAAEVHIAYRHPTPEFAKSEWGWINSVLDVLPDHPGWFRDLSSEQRASLSNTMRREGRLKLEPWLADRINRKEITLHPNTEVSNCTTLPSGDLSISLTNGALLNADHVILATGFNPDIRAIKPLARGNLIERISLNGGFPALDRNFQSSVKNLFFTGFIASNDFGPLFGFTATARASAKIIGEILARPEPL
jgi:hypothetical protein